MFRCPPSDVDLDIGNGRRQAREDAMKDRRILSSFREAILREERNRPIREPMPRPALLEMLSKWEPLDEELPDVEDLGQVEDVRL
jgi:hypothetical protein